MADKKPNPAFEFILESLKKDRKATFADIRDAAAKKKLDIYPIMYGRAQALLGIVKLAPRGQGKAKVAKEAKAAKAAKAAGAAVVKRGPGRPPKSATKSPSISFDGSIEGIVAAVKASEQSKARYRSALEKIQSILADALA